VARIGRPGADLRALCLAHTDTVFGPGEAAKHPFRMEGGLVHGLGAADCKGGVAVSLYGAAIALELGLLPESVELVLVYTCDEETGSATGRGIFEAEAPEADYALVFEPARGENGLITARKGCAMGRVEVSGREAHGGSAYPSGADANLALAKAIVAISEANDHDAGRFFNFGTISGGKHPDIVSDRAEAGFFVTFGDDAELSLIKKALAEAADGSRHGCSLKYDLAVSFPTLAPTPESLATYRRIKAVGALMGLALPEQSSPGSSDGCWLASLGLPVVDALGPYMRDIHTTKESALLKSFPERTALFAALIASLGGWPRRAGKAAKGAAGPL
jgi:glutamate carboxypeptidase